jgi:CHASE3 domain sensor protein
MNRYSEPFGRIGAVGFALIMVTAWSVMTLAYAYNQSLACMNDSFGRGVVAVNLLDDVRNTVDRLGIDLRAFLATGDPRFQDGVWNGVASLDHHLDELRGLVDRDGVQGARAARLSAAVKQVLTCVAQSYDVKDARGARAALAFFDTHDAVISAAKSQADDLKAEVLANISDQMVNAHGGSSLLKAMLHGAPAGLALRRAPGPARALALAH